MKEGRNDNKSMTKNIDLYILQMSEDTARETWLAFFTYKEVQSMLAIMQLHQTNVHGKISGIELID